LADDEIAISNGVQPRRLEALDKTARRPFFFNAQNERLDLPPTPLKFDEDTLAGVIHPPGKPELFCESEDTRAKTDSLDCATDR
jgi:hypothetical protein